MDPKELRIVFMGTPDFAVASLKALVEAGYQIVGVITAPDRPSGRGKKVSESAVKRYALEQNLKILQPEKLKNEQFLKELRALKADLQVVVAFRMLPEVVWDMPPLGTFNLHGSLLPQYRGAAPLNWAVMNGEKKTGVTTFLLDHQIDTGQILFKREVEIGENDTVGDVHDRLLDIGASLVIDTVDALAGGEVKPVSQSMILPGSELKHAPKIFKEDCRIDWKKPAEVVRNHIRGLSPYPAAWTNLVSVEDSGEIQTKVFFASRTDVDEPAQPGSIKTDGKTFLEVACSDGWLSVQELQIAGKRKMRIDEFLRGFQNIKNYKFT